MYVTVSESLFGGIPSPTPFTQHAFHAYAATALQHEHTLCPACSKLKYDLHVASALQRLPVCFFGKKTGSYQHSSPTEQMIWE